MKKLNCSNPKYEITQTTYRCWEVLNKEKDFIYYTSWNPHGLWLCTCQWIQRYPGLQCTHIKLVKESIGFKG